MKLKYGIVRFARVFVSFAIAGFSAAALEINSLIWVTPVISGIAKVLRDNFPDKMKWLPI